MINHITAQNPEVINFFPQFLISEKSDNYKSIKSLNIIAGIYTEVNSVLGLADSNERWEQWKSANTLMRQKACVLIDTKLLDEIMCKYKFPEVILNYLWVLLLTSPRRTPTMKANAHLIKDYVKKHMVGIEYLLALEESEGLRLLIRVAHDIEEPSEIVDSCSTTQSQPISHYMINITDCNIGSIIGSNNSNYDGKQKREDCQGTKAAPNANDIIVAKAIRIVMKLVNAEGQYVFRFQSQWEGILFILRELNYYFDPDYSFGEYLRRIGLDDLRVNLPGKDVGRKHIWKRVKSLEEWRPKRDELKIYNIAKILKEEIEKLTQK